MAARVIPDLSMLVVPSLPAAADHAWQFRVQGGKAWLSDGTNWIEIGGGGTMNTEGFEAYQVLMDPAVDGAAVDALLSTDRGQYGFYVLMDIASARIEIIETPAALAAIVDSSLAMDAIVASEDLLAIMYAQPAVWSAFVGSTALPAAAVPTMTGPTTPSGVASASTDNGSSLPWRAFDNNPNLGWISAHLQTTGQWLQYEFASPVFIHTCSVYGSSGGNAADPKDWALQCSHDGASWEHVGAFTNPSSTTTALRTVVKAGRYKYWRFAVSTIQGTSNNVRVLEAKLLGFQ